MVDIVEQLVTVHRVLRQLEDPVTYVGGAVVPLHIDDPGAPEPRPTHDVDTIIQATSYGEYMVIADQLRSLGLRESTNPNAPLSRWMFEDVPVDVMPVRSEKLGIQNEWYEEGVQNAVWIDIGPFEIRVFSPLYLLADKINAFRDRGEGDYYGSPDFEDIVRLVDGCSDLVDQVRDENEKVSVYIEEWVNKLLEERKPGELIRAHIRQRGRAEIILRRFREMVR